jgi:hypothetical protein
MPKKRHYISIYGRRYGIDTFSYKDGFCAECVKFRNIVSFSENEQDALMDMKTLLEIRIASLMKSVVQIVNKT